MGLRFMAMKLQFVVALALHVFATAEPSYSSLGCPYPVPSSSYKCDDPNNSGSASNCPITKWDESKGFCVKVKNKQNFQDSEFCLKRSDICPDSSSNNGCVKFFSLHQYTGAGGKRPSKKKNRKRCFMRFEVKKGSRGQIPIEGTAGTLQVTSFKVTYCMQTSKTESKKTQANCATRKKVATATLAGASNELGKMMASMEV